MVRQRNKSDSPSVEVRDFTLETIERGLEKLRRRAAEVKRLEPGRLSFDDPSVDNLAFNIGETIRDVFGTNSAEFQRYKVNRQFGNRYVALEAAQLQANFVKCVPGMATMLTGLIARLEEKRIDLEHEESRETATPPDAPKTCEADCPNCGKNRSAEIVASYEDNIQHDPQQIVWSIATYRILRCCGCQSIYIQCQTQFSEDVDWEIDEDPETGKLCQTVVPPRPVTIWPLPQKRPRPPWVKQLAPALRDLLDEVYGALDADHPVLAAIGTRTVLDVAMVKIGVDETLQFADKLEQLRKEGKISNDQKETFSILINAGSAAVHRGWRPDREQLGTLMDGMENFLHHAFVVGNAVDAMKDTVPPRKQRAKTPKRGNGS